MNAGVTEEVGKVTNTFMDILRGQPLSLALVAMNVLLVVFLFYSNNQVLAQREAALNQIVGWQRQTDTLMANCVSKDVVQVIVNALERDRELYRQMLKPLDAPQLLPKPQSDGPKPLLFEMPP